MLCIKGLEVQDWKKRLLTDDVTFRENELLIRGGITKQTQNPNVGTI